MEATTVKPTKGNLIVYSKAVDLLLQMLAMHVIEHSIPASAPVCCAARIVARLLPDMKALKEED
jgi:hypothetical protein